MTKITLRLDRHKGLRIRNILLLGHCSAHIADDPHRKRRCPFGFSDWPFPGNVQLKREQRLEAMHIVEVRSARGRKLAKSKAARLQMFPFLSCKNISLQAIHVIFHQPEIR